MSNSSPAGLPQPDAKENAHSEKLKQLIIDQIQQQGGCIGFDQYMQMSLYQPGLGYYNTALNPFGESGDFVTAVEISPLFAACLANQCEQIFQTGVPPRIMEFGAGSGKLASQLLAACRSIGVNIEQYSIIELSPTLSSLQRQTIENNVPQFAARVEWLEQLPQQFSGVIIANEVVDAMPVTIFQYAANQILLRSVCIEDNQLVWQSRPLSDDRLRQKAEKIITRYHLPQPYLSEINCIGESWIGSIGAMLKHGVALIIDYGFPGSEYYHSQRSNGTLMCHYRHHSHDDPLILTGLQDITAHVDFTAMSEAGIEAGLSVGGFTTQAYFLLANGLEQAAQLNMVRDQKELLIRTQAIKKLTLPNEMGELFKVLALQKNVNEPLKGFQIIDHRHRLDLAI